MASRESDCTPQLIPEWCASDNVSIVGFPPGVARLYRKSQVCTAPICWMLARMAAESIPDRLQDVKMRWFRRLSVRFGFVPRHLTSTQCIHTVVTSCDRLSVVYCLYRSGSVFSNVLNGCVDASFWRYIAGMCVRINSTQDGVVRRWSC